jgi:RNA polymerase subunit RPABC4/transcription elongation factor Spt4
MEPLQNLSINLGAILQVLLAFFGAFGLALWLSLIIWTFRDIRARTRDIFAVLLATLLVLIFNVPGLLLYLLLRPRETLAEQYERSLEEEALLQEIEDRRVCPSCHEPVEDDFLICPNCSTRLKNQCSNCNRLMRLEWNVCPYCGT